MSIRHQVYLAIRSIWSSGQLAIRSIVHHVYWPSGLSHSSFLSPLIFLWACDGVDVFGLVGSVLYSRCSCLLLLGGVLVGKSQTLPVQGFSVWFVHAGLHLHGSTIRFIWPSGLFGHQVYYAIRSIMASGLLCQQVYYAIRSIGHQVHWPSGLFGHQVHWPSGQLAIRSFWPSGLYGHQVYWPSGLLARQLFEIVFFIPNHGLGLALQAKAGLGLEEEVNFQVFEDEMLYWIY